ncbi:hypothetical protein BE221DRAFT_148308 [Ostreococcus tauri]|uniref:P-loop containing nucleoside triphosphate hydrolase n=1 Tax=Ostreococcus tauri TaxID=70448 RepID=A0A1Y5I5U9_OSTTA|nr:hypothetical protein BE221DRAFT_148308 [Ostreococcus tauri]
MAARARSVVILEFDQSKVDKPRCSSAAACLSIGSIGTELCDRYSLEASQHGSLAASPILWTTWHRKNYYYLAMARHCYGAQLGEMTLELNASDDRGISVIRSEIQSFAASQRLFNAGYKLVILDECDNMTKDAQFALRRL